MPMTSSSKYLVSLYLFVSAHLSISPLPPRHYKAPLDPPPFIPQAQVPDPPIPCTPCTPPSLGLVLQTREQSREYGNTVPPPRPTHHTHGLNLEKHRGQIPRATPYYLILIPDTLVSCLVFIHSTPSLTGVPDPVPLRPVLRPPFLYPVARPCSCSRPRPRLCPLFVHDN